jgi:Polysaccharide lyase family 4, domain II
MKTDDPVLHTFDVHASVGGKELFHMGLHEKGSSVTKKIPKAGLMELSCYVHPWQRAYIYVFDHPYAAITDEKGRFTIKDIPPGTYAVEAWHEALGTRKIANVKIESGKTSTIELEYTAQ